MANQLITGDGHFNENSIEAFKKALNMEHCGHSYTVVSIMGPQSSGKSTLLNHLFRTNFKEMDARKGRPQTTKGIWVAKGVGMDRCTIVMDLEGSDGSEREDDTTFQNQSALFALAVSDIVLINLWCHDIGREQAASKPLLKTVFQVMTLLFSPRKTTLLFVIRDPSKSPLEILEHMIRKDIQKIWVSVRKPEAHRETPLGEFFNIEVVALSNYEEKEEQFKEQVTSLRQRLYHSTFSGGLDGDRRAVVPAAEFFVRAQQLWKVIKENKNLDLPAYKVIVATFLCEEIVKEKFAGFSSDERWRRLENAVQHGLVPHFGQTLSQLLDEFLTGYDMEAQYLDDGVRTEKRMELESKLLQLAYPAYESMLSHRRSKTLDAFEEAFNKALDRALKRGEGFSVAVRDCTQSLMSVFDAGCEEAVVEQAKWNCLKVREKVMQDIDARVASVRNDILSKFNAKYEGQLKKALVEGVEVLLDAASDDTWPRIRKLLKRETESALFGLSSDLCAFGIDCATTNKLPAGLWNYARNVVESKVREEAARDRVSIRMKDRFEKSFTRDPSGMPRFWTGDANIKEITTTARAAALKLLSVMAVIRMDDDIDNIDDTLSGVLSAADNGIQSDVILASSSWAKVPPTRTLIKPAECKHLWGRFIAETEGFVTQAMATQANANRQNTNSMQGVMMGVNVFTACASLTASAMTILHNSLS